MSKLDRAGIVDRIYERLGKSITKNIIDDALAVIIDNIETSIINGESIHIDKFCTIYTYTFHGHNGVNIATGEVQFVEPFQNVKLEPHENLKYLIENKKEIFKNS